MPDNGRISKLNNAGFSLVELLVVIGILSIMTGASALGMNFAFSRDASKCATRLNDAIYMARMDSMSKQGDYFLEIKKEDNDFVAIINDGSSEVYHEKISEHGRISNIAYDLNGTGDNISDTKIVKIEFDKAKGNVEKYNDVGFSADGSSGTNVDGLIVFTISQKNGLRTSKVTLVTSTGKHKIGN